MINDQITEHLKDAMRAKDSRTLTVLRALKTALKNAAIEKGGADAELDDTAAIAIVRKQISQREESSKTFRDNDRAELADNEDAEIEVLNKYLPEELSADELGSMVDAAIAEVGATSRKEMGAVMKILQDQVAGRADNKAVSSAVMAKLG